MRFDRKDDPSPISVPIAVQRGQLMVNGPVQLILLSGIGIAYFLIERSGVAAGFVALLGFILAWLWWSYFIPEWREWPHSRGADPEELQDLAVRTKLTWPKGSFFERTEIRRSGR